MAREALFHGTQKPELRDLRDFLRKARNELRGDEGFAMSTVRFWKLNEEN